MKNKNKSLLKERNSHREKQSILIKKSSPSSLSHKGMVEPTKCEQCNILKNIIDDLHKTSDNFIKGINVGG